MLSQGIKIILALDYKVKSCSVLSDSLRPHGLLLEARLLEWVTFSLLQRIFPTQESNHVFLHCRRILYQLNYLVVQWLRLCFPGGSDGKAADSIPGSGRSPEEGNGNPLQYSFLENPVDRGA